MTVGKRTAWRALMMTVAVVLITTGSASARATTTTTTTTTTDGNGEDRTTIGAVQQWVTRADDGQQTEFVRWGDLFFSGGGPAHGDVAEIDPHWSETWEQGMEGFGGTLTESSAAVLAALKQSNGELYWRTLRRLFTHEDTAGGGASGRLNAVRVPLSSSDFALDDYTLHDHPADARLPNMTLAPLERWVLPVLSDIVSVQRDVYLMVSPWTGPIWMKDNPSFHWGTLRTDMEAAYGQYLAQAVGLLETRLGRGIDALTLQNEPLHDPCTYACMRMGPDQQARVARHTRAALRALGRPSVAILVFDHNWDDAWYPTDVFVRHGGGGAEGADGAAFHCYTDPVHIAQQEAFHRATGGAHVHMTECSGGAWATDYAANLHYAGGLLGVQGTTYYARSILLFNIALDQYSGPQLNGCTNCRGIVTAHRPQWDTARVPQAVASVSYNVEYPALAHFARFVRKGFRRIRLAFTHAPAAPECFRAVAFYHPQTGELALVLNNFCSAPRAFSLVQKGLGAALNMGFVAPGMLTLYYNVYSLNVSASPHHQQPQPAVVVQA